MTSIIMLHNRLQNLDVFTPKKEIGARSLQFFSHQSLLLTAFFVYARRGGGSGKTAHLYRLVLALTARLCDKHQILYASSFEEKLHVKVRKTTRIRNGYNQVPDLS